MVRNHIRKTDRTPDGDLMRRAVEAVGGNNSIRKVAKTCGILYPTFICGEKSISPAQMTYVPHYDNKRIFTELQE